ncbi:MAG: hypothetical protein SFU98_18955 [Leptospiraceae bacterium]|nr:hypothetical protein [Leptospiraceae bacterium]
MKKLLILILVSFLLTCNFNKDNKLISIIPLTTTQANLSNQKSITAFSFDQISPPVTAIITGTSITANLPNSVNLTNLVPSFTTTGRQVLVNQTVQTSAITSNDFSKTVVYTVQAEDSSTQNYSVSINNTGFHIIGSSGEVNITGLSSSDSPLIMYYNSGGNTFSSFANNTKIGVILASGTEFIIGIQSQPTGKVCALSSGTFSGTLSANVSFQVNCVSGYLVGGKILSRLSTFSIPTDGAMITSIAGSLPPTALAGTNDGIGGAARFNQPYGITSDGANLYIADSGNHCIRKFVISTSEVTTIAGSCGVSGTTDGASSVARFDYPMFTATDGTNLYICDRGNNSIRKLELSTGNVSTFAGLNGVSGDLNGIGTNARLNFPNGVTTDGTYLYVSDRNNHKIKRVHIASTVVDTLAGNGIAAVTDGNGTSASFNTPCDSVSTGSNLYVVECGGNVVRRVSLTSPFTVTTIAGNGVATSVDGIGTSASFQDPHGVETDGANLFIMEWGGAKIRRLNLSTLGVFTIAGGVYGYQDGTGTTAFMQNLGGVTSDGNNLYFLDAYNSSLRRINNAPD